MDLSVCVPKKKMERNHRVLRKHLINNKRKKKPELCENQSSVFVSDYAMDCISIEFLNWSSS